MKTALFTTNAPISLRIPTLLAEGLLSAMIMRVGEIRLCNAGKDGVMWLSIEKEDRGDTLNYFLEITSTSPGVQSKSQTRVICDWVYKADLAMYLPPNSDCVGFCLDTPNGAYSAYSWPMERSGALFTRDTAPPFMRRLW